MRLTWGMTVKKADQGQEQNDIKDLGHLVMPKRGKFLGLHCF
jgi:hypothetical protein